MGIKKLGNKILYKLGLKQRPVLTKVEQWRARGVTIGENFDGPDSAIDYCFGHLAADLICKPQEQLLRR